MFGRLVPYPLKVALVRLRREPEMFIARRTSCREKSNDYDAFTYELASHETPLRRKTTTYGERMQQGKETNVRLVAGILDGTVVEPSGSFSFHALVGRPKKRRGFVLGPEMQRGELQAGLGGGACSVSNMLYWIAINAGMKITERHRHGLDLFPDHGRTVPFACGATVFYNQADLRFVNPLDVPVLLSLTVVGETLIGRLLATEDPGLRFVVYEKDHSFKKQDGRTLRENRIMRRVLSPDGRTLVDEEIAHNRAVVLYDWEAQD